MFDNDLNMTDLSGDRVYEVPAAGQPRPVGQTSGITERRRRQPQRRRRGMGGPGQRVQDHFEELAEAAAIANQRLIRQGSKYRFCIFRETGRIILESVLLDKDGGSVAASSRRDVTNLDFLLFLAHIEEGEGLYFERFL